MEHLSNDHQNCPNPYENSHKLCHETGHPVVEFDGKSVKTETATWSNFSNGWKTIVDQILASEEINKSKWPGLWESQSGIQVRKLTIWVRLSEIITEFPRCISLTRTGYPVLMMDVKVPKDKYISRWIDWENLIYVRWNRIKNVHKDKY